MVVAKLLLLLLLLLLFKYLSVDVRSSEDSKLSNKSIESRKSFLQTKLPINIPKPEPMAFVSEAHLVDGQLRLSASTLNKLSPKNYDTQSLGQPF
jgi:hypothetical protein